MRCEGRRLVCPDCGEFSRVQTIESHDPLDDSNRRVPISQPRVATEYTAGFPASPMNDPHHWVGRYFQTLGAELERRTGDATADGEGFAKAATAVLAEVGPPQPVDARAMAEWIASGDALPRQVNFKTGFGEPPLAVYVARNFYLEVLFWFPNCTDIHGHGFSGAFRVLDGYSLQTTYAFVENERWHEGLRRGELKLRNLELLVPGEVCDIRASEAFVHCVAHMGFPSLTLVARNFGESGVTQFRYFRCGLAYAAHHRRQEQTRRLDVLLALARRDPAEAVRQLKILLERQDPFDRFVTCLKLAERGDASLSIESLAWAETKWPEATALVRQAHAEAVRGARIFEGLARLPDAQSQMIGALGALCGGRDAAMRALTEFFPKDPPEATLARWAASVPGLPGARLTAFGAQR